MTFRNIYITQVDARRLSELLREADGHMETGRATVLALQHELDRVEGGPAEFVRHGETGFVVSDNQDSIGWGIGTALANREDADQMGQNGRHLAENQFSWNEIACSTEEIYASVS